MRITLQLRRQDECAPQHGPRELARRHRLCEQEALDHIEAHLAHREKVGFGLDTFGDRARTAITGEFENSVAYHLLQPIVGAPVHELSIDLQLGEGKVDVFQQRRPFVAEVVDRNADVVNLS